MKNLLDSLETRSLSFDECSVFNLIAQSLWQIGPLNTIKGFFPESHFDLTQTNYFTVLTQILDEYLNLITKKWNDYVVLYVIIVIIQRIITLIDDDNNNFEKMISLLRKCRKTSKDWEKMLKQVDNGENSTILMHVCCFTLLTFNIDSRYLKDAMRNDDDIVDWLESFAILNKHKNKSNSIKSHFLMNLFDQVEICSVRVADQYLHVIENNKGLALTRLVRLIWPDKAAKLGLFHDWRNIYGHVYPFWLKTKCQTSDNMETILHVNVKGEFLVNGFPNGTLPSAIRNHHDYKRFFGTLDFEVHPASNGIGSFVSALSRKNENDSLTYFLAENSFGNFDLVLMEHRNNTISRLIPHSLFEEHFPESFTQNFSHWLNTETNCIEFRLNNYAEYRENLNKAVEFKFNMNKLFLIDCNNNDRCLIDIKSEVFRQITEKITNRIEQKSRVHVFTKIDYQNEYYINFPCLNLKFTYNVVKNCVFSDDFKGIVIKLLFLNRKY